MTSDLSNLPTEDLTPQAIPSQATPEIPPSPVTQLQVEEPPAETPTAETPTAETTTPTVETPAAKAPTAAAAAETPTAETPAAETPPTKPAEPPAVSPSKNQTIQVRFKTEHGKLLLILPAEQVTLGGPLSYSWTEVLDQLKQRLTTESRSWPANTSLYVVARDRLLTVQHLQELADILQTAKLQIRRLYTSRRQTAIAGVTAGYCVDQQLAPEPVGSTPSETATAMAEPLVLRTTLRSGVEIRHNGTVVVMGDLNPGSSIVATGDVLVWGRLRGNVHAGAKGNGRSRIMALQMEPAQIRIADFVARGPSTAPQQFFPEVAYVNPQGRISIARASELAKNDTAIGLKMPATGRVFSQPQ